jgi:peptide/nickel transport system permease protein
LSVEPNNQSEVSVAAATGASLGRSSEIGRVKNTSQGRGTRPFTLAWRRLRKNKLALIAGGVFLLMVILCLAAPLYAEHIAHMGPNQNNVSGQIKVNGKLKNVVSIDDLPIGPTFHKRYLFGADSLGRDLAVRTLYGGRTTLFIGALATIITMIGATILGVFAGFYRGATDAIISRVLDLIWAYPALLLGIALGVALALNGLVIGGVTIIGAGSNLLPALVIGVVYIPYVARPIRGEVLSLREREFVDAARILGFSRLRIMVTEILPNLSSTLLVFLALQLAQSVVLEASLSFLGAGVQPPNASWGTLLEDGTQVIVGSPHLVLVPGIMLIITVLAVNVFGDGVRQAFDPRARIRVER